MSSYSPRPRVSAQPQLHVDMDIMPGKRVKIRRGDFRGYGRTVKLIAKQRVKVQLDTNSRTIHVVREDIVN